MQPRKHRQNSQHFAYANLLAALIKQLERKKTIYKKLFFALPRSLSMLKKYKVSFTVF